MRSSAGIRSIGWLLLILGLLLVVGFGSVIIAALPTMLDPAAAVAKHTFDGTLQQAKALNWVFLACFGCGLVLLFCGVSLVKAGRPVRYLNLMMWIAIAAVLWTVYQAMKVMPHVGA